MVARDNPALENLGPCRLFRRPYGDGGRARPGVETPDNTDSVSFVPTLHGQPGKQQAHEYLYWEFYEGGSSQAVRLRHWKGVRKPMLTGRIELYDVSRDLGEKYDLARNHPDVVKEIEGIMARAHVKHPNWKMRPPR